MKIVAFLQNMWFKRPEVMCRQLAETFKGDREAFIRTWLFWSCLTGKRLRAALGESLCDHIVWEEQSPEIGGQSSASFPPDFDHIDRVLQKHQPEIVLAFGKSATHALSTAEAMARLSGKPVSWRFIRGPHPAARHSTVVAELRDVARQVEAAMLTAAAEIARQ
jgi:hypothetical protein